MLEILHEYWKFLKENIIFTWFFSNFAPSWRFLPDRGAVCTEKGSFLPSLGLGHLSMASEIFRRFCYAVLEDKQGQSIDITWLQITIFAK